MFLKSSRGSERTVAAPAETEDRFEIINFEEQVFSWSYLVSNDLYYDFEELGTNQEYRAGR